MGSLENPNIFKLAPEGVAMQDESAIDQDIDFTISGEAPELPSEPIMEGGSAGLSTESTPTDNESDEVSSDDDLDFPTIGEVPELPDEERLLRELELNYVFLKKDVEELEKKLRETELKDNVLNVVAAWVLGIGTLNIVPTAMDLAGKKIFNFAAEVKQKLDEAKRKHDAITKEMRQITGRRLQREGAVYERKFDSDSQVFREELILTDSQIEAEKAEMERELAILAARAESNSK